LANLNDFLRLAGNERLPVALTRGFLPTGPGYSDALGEGTQWPFEGETPTF
jgi:hypothetical protein